MLRELAVQNLALIEDVRVELQPGFCAWTGETGAGKTLPPAAGLPAPVTGRFRQPGAGPGELRYFRGPGTRPPPPARPAHCRAPAAAARAGPAALRARRTRPGEPAARRAGRIAARAR